MKLSHIHLKVRDLDRAIRFYKTMFDLSVRERIGDRYAFLSNDETHHNVALQSIGQNAIGASLLAVGLYHAAFEVDDKMQFACFYRRLRGTGIQAASVDHQISWAVYFNDPDGNGLEVFCDTRTQPGASTNWSGNTLSLSEAQIEAVLQE